MRCRARRLAWLIVVPVVASSACSDGASAASFCDEVQQVIDVVAGVEISADTTPEQMRQTAERYFDEVEDLEAAAPSEISDDVALVVRMVRAFRDASADLIDAMANADDPQAAAQAAQSFQPDVTEDDMARAEAAMLRVEEYVERECEVDLSDAGIALDLGSFMDAGLEQLDDAFDQMDEVFEHDRPEMPDIPDIPDPPDMP